VIIDVKGLNYLCFNLFVATKNKAAYRLSSVNKIQTNMLVYIEVFTGKTLALEVDPDDHVEHVKQQIHKKGGIPIEPQLLFLLGKQLPTIAPT
jgi:hypothetical protein